MGKAGHLARDAAQAKARLAAVIAVFSRPSSKPSFGGDELQEKLAIVAGAQRARNRLRASSGSSWPER
jgi:hypothetical protein